MKISCNYTPRQAEVSGTALERKSFEIIVGHTFCLDYPSSIHCFISVYLQKGQKGKYFHCQLLFPNKIRCAKSDFSLLTMKGRIESNQNPRIIHPLPEKKRNIFIIKLWTPFRFLFLCCMLRAINRAPGFLWRPRWSNMKDDTTLNQNPPLTENISSFNWPQVSFLIADNRIPLSGPHPPNRLLICSPHSMEERRFLAPSDIYAFNMYMPLELTIYYHYTSSQSPSSCPGADVDPDWINTKVRNIKRILHSLWTRRVVLSLTPYKFSLPAKLLTWTSHPLSSPFRGRSVPKYSDHSYFGPSSVTRS